jgi:NitT/TauT family transport system substrate-binding protein
MRFRPLVLTLLLGSAACGGQAAPPASPSTSTPAAASPVAPSAAAKPAASGSAAAAAGLVKLNTSYPNVDMGHLHLWVAEETGIFQKNGIDVNDQLVANAAAGMAGLLSGQIDIAQSGGSDAVIASASGADVIDLAVQIPVYTYLLEVPAIIKTVDQLKGGKIGIDSFGSSPDIAVRVALKKAGLDPDKDVSILPVGNIPTRAAALMQGALQGTVLNPPSSLTVEDKGFHPLINLAELKLPAVSQSTVAMRPWVTVHKDLTQKYIDSLIQADVRIRQDKAGTTKIMSKYLKNDDERQMSYAYDFYVGQVYPTAPFPKPEMFQDSVAELAKTNDKVKNVDMAKLLDPSFVQSAVDRGLPAQK